jgi:hypothetical protein
MGDGSAQDAFQEREAEWEMGWAFVRKKKDQGGIACTRGGEPRQRPARGTGLRRILYLELHYLW